MVRQKQPYLKICNRCGAENARNAKQCSTCGSYRFAPAWVIAKRTVNKQVGVEITKSDPKYGSVQERITLSKWWPGGRSSFHVPTIGQWEAIEDIVNNDLGPLIGWRSKRELVVSVKEKKKEQRKVSKDLSELVREYPDFLKQVVGAVDPSKIGKDDMDEVLSVMKQLTDAATGLDKGFKNAFLSVVKKLPKQKKRALEDLEDLLGHWSLQQITTVAQQVQHRLATIDLFKTQVMDERTYEIRGTNSIHRILERSMWLIDERYWLLQSNETLRTFIGDEMGKLDRKRYGKLRPDFVCGMVGDRLLIIEIKRPSHVLDTVDLNQLETYVTLAEKYKGFRSYEAYLIGNRKGDDLERRLKHRSSSFRVWTYSDLLDSTESRYRDYLKTQSAA